MNFINNFIVECVLSIISSGYAYIDRNQSFSFKQSRVFKKKKKKVP
jgi:hypothetical protein